MIIKRGYCMHRMIYSDGEVIFEACLHKVAELNAAVCIRQSLLHACRNERYIQATQQINHAC